MSATSAFTDDFLEHTGTKEVKCKIKCEGLSGVADGWAGKGSATLISTLDCIYVNLILSLSVSLSPVFLLSF